MVLRQEQVHLGRRLGGGRELEHHRDAVDGVRFEGLRDRHRGRNDRPSRRAHAVDLSKTRIDRPARATRQRRPELIRRPPAHGVAGHDALGDHGVHETCWRDDRRASRGDLGRVHDPAHSAVVVAVAMRVDDRDDRPLRTMCEVQVKGGAGRTHRAERVHDDETVRPLDEGDIGQCQPAHLINAGHDHEQPVDGIQPRQAPQARVHRVRRRLVAQEAVVPRVLRGWQRRDEPASRVDEVLLVGKRQIAECRVVLCPHARRRCVRSRGLSQSGAGPAPHGDHHARQDRSSG